MKEHLNRRTVILLGLCVLAAAFVMFDLFSGRKAPRPSQSPADPAAAARLAQAQAKISATKGATSGPVPAAGPEIRLAPPPVPDGPWGRDPFAIAAKYLPQGTKGPDRFAGYKVWGVICSPQGCQAVVNDLVVRAGDRVDGGRIVRITKDGVEMEKNGETRLLTPAGTGMFR